MAQRVETIVIGGGQAGLSMSYFLAQAGREHAVLEQAAASGEAWRNHRWDSFTLVTPNWTFKLPGAEYQGDAPDGFMPRDEIVSRFEQYVERYHLPVLYNTPVASVERLGDGEKYRITTSAETYLADQVVVATGLFQQPKTLPFSANLPTGILQLHSDEYHNPDALPPGAILVVGSGQSGCQIAEELYQSGRKVYLSTSGAGRVPRRYRGQDIVWWLDRNGFFDRTADRLPSPKDRFAANPHLSGKDGGHTLNLHQFARDGVTLLGHIRGAQDGKIWLAPDLRDNLARSDRAETEILKMIDDYIQSMGLDAPPEELQKLEDGYTVEILTELDLHRAGIATVIWAIGYQFDFSLVRLPVVDDFGYPLQNQGMTAYPGLYFLGLPWLRTFKSGLLLGVGQDAALVASKIISGKSQS